MSHSPEELLGQYKGMVQAGVPTPASDALRDSGLNAAQVLHATGMLNANQDTQLAQAASGPSR